MRMILKENNRSLFKVKNADKSDNLNLKNNVKVRMHR